MAWLRANGEVVETMADSLIIVCQAQAHEEVPSDVGVGVARLLRAGPAPGGGGGEGEPAAAGGVRAPVLGAHHPLPAYGAERIYGGRGVRRPRRAAERPRRSAVRL